MLRKIMIVLAIALVLGGSALSSTAFAGGGGYGGGSGLGEAGLRGQHFAGASGGRRKVNGLRGGFHEYRHGDVWGHWGAYYGPMVFVR